MRFIGNKSKLLNEIENFITEKVVIKAGEVVFCDLFSGSASVSRYFKNKYKIVSNDQLYFSYIIQKATLELKEIPKFECLIKYFGFNNFKEILTYYEEVEAEEIREKFEIEKKELFIHNNYTPVESNNRMYFSCENGKRIDLFRISLNKFLEKGLITENEFVYLLALLIESVPFYSNISGVYGAYLKYWDKRALKPFKFIDLEIIDNKRKNISFNQDAHDLIKSIKGDILYLDPPYNGRQYLPNYHILETIAKYDYPEIKGVTGIRKYEEKDISKFCRKKEVKDALEDIIKNSKFKHIIMSYSTDGILSIEEISEIFKNHGVEESFVIANPIEYRKYKSKHVQEKQNLHELLFYIEKKVDLEIEESLKNEFLKCPFNYIGGKHKILPQLIERFPKEIDCFVDLFGGGFNVGINIDSKSVIYNDQLTPLVNLFKYFQEKPEKEIFSYIEETIIKYDIRKDNSEGFKKLREDYNNASQKKILDFYILICYSFNYQIRFNNSGEYNCPHGTNRSSYSENLKKRLKKFIEVIKNKNIQFNNKDFLDIDFNKLTQNSLVYCDPPYLITTGSYNDGNRGFKNWTQQEEKKLLELLDYLNKKGIKFALSNVLIHDGKKNEILINWLEERKYKIFEINSNYKNANYQKNKDNKNITKEVLIINY